MKCPDCAADGQRLLGDVPSARRFAGRRLCAPLPGGQLWHCPQCELRYRWPRLDLDRLNELYVAGADDNWSSVATRRFDWVTAADWILPNVREGGSLLDIGCFDGGFLDHVGPTYRRCGIEIHPAAREVARSRGITLLAEEFDALSGIDERFDCITAFDVIEHVPSPVEFLAHCSRLLEPGGLIVISTGNANAASFRLMQGAYWYSVIPEHISFVSPAWSAWAADRCGLTLKRTKTFCHARKSRLFFPVELAANVTYRFAPAAYGTLRRLRSLSRGGSSSTDELQEPPSWVTARDHFITLFEKPV